MCLNSESWIARDKDAQVLFSEFLLLGFKGLGTIKRLSFKRCRASPSSGPVSISASDTQVLCYFSSTIPDTLLIYSAFLWALGCPFLTSSFPWTFPEDIFLKYLNIAVVTV